MCRSADSTIPSAVGPPCFARRSFSSEPAFTPMRIGILRSLATATTSCTNGVPPMLPGFRRSPSTPCASAISASL